MRTSLAATVLAAALVPPMSPGASDSLWDNLEGLRNGQRIKVVRMDWKSSKGRLLSYSEKGIIVSTKGGEVPVPREDVLRGTLQERSRRLRNALIGAAHGAGGGTAIAGHPTLYRAPAPRRDWWRE